jgi:FeS assembly SUF system protein
MSESAENTEVKVASAAIPDLKDKVMAAIKTVYDPEIPVDIYELGLIYEMNIYPVNNVYILMTLTSPSCPSAETIPSEVEQRVKAVEGVQDVKVELTFDPPYSQDMMSEAAKLELGFL